MLGIWNDNHFLEGVTFGVWQKIEGCLALSSLSVLLSFPPFLFPFPPFISFQRFYNNNELHAVLHDAP
jgi:hypothetical protein